MLQQTDLFSPVSTQMMTISEAADILSVSEASVRNWIKTGYLQFERHIGISRQSFDHFRRDVVGKDKLVKRANKSFANRYGRGCFTEAALSEFRNNIVASNIAEEYQNSLSDAYRNKEGIYYTPENICRTLFSDIKQPAGEQTFCDPCCGSGNFIMAAIRHGFLPENIYGYDTDPIAVEVAKRRIFEETGYVTHGIICRDFLELSTQLGSNLPKFDAVVTNPPWGKKIQKSEKVKYGKFLGAGRSLDSCSLFLFAALKILNNDGFLAFLLPEAFFKIAAFQDARRRALDYKAVSVRDFGKPFKGLVTRAQSICIQKTKHQSGNVLCVTKDASFERGQSSFFHKPAHIINFESAPEDESVLAEVFAKPHITLENKADWGLGIVTGNNNRFCRKELSVDFMPVYKGTDIHKGYTDKPTHFIPKDLSLYQQVAPIRLFEAAEKLLYRFISSDLVFYHDKRQSYCLNSVNMLIVSDKFPISAENIVKIFNTDLFNWLFGKLFNTHKILRADLEKMPLPIEFLQQAENFSEQALLAYYGVKKLKNGTFRLKG